MGHSDITVIVLAGGHSSRLGTDKALLRLDGTRTLLETVVMRMKHLGPEVIVVSKVAIEIVGARNVTDAIPDGGPLGGLCSGLQAARFSHCLVVACDMPFLNLRLLSYMAERPRNYDALVPRLGVGTRAPGIHPLHAIYTKRCLPAIETVLASGSRVIRDFYPKVNTVYIDGNDINGIDRECLSFFNINTPQDLAQAQTLLVDNP